MLQVAATIWQEIAQLGTKTPIGRLFQLSQEQQNQAHEREANRLERAGVDPQVALAYLEVAPLLAEREAIAKYKNQHPAKFDYLENALPEVNTIQSAVLLSTRSHHLTPTQQTQLSELLKSLNSLERSEQRNAPQPQSR